MGGALTKIEDVLALLSKGAKEWNDHLSILRDQEFGSDINDPEIRIENVTFEDLDIEEFEFSSIIFYRCMFKKCHFSSCRWAGAEFVECTMDVALFIDGDGEDLKITSSKPKIVSLVIFEWGKEHFPIQILTKLILRDAAGMEMSFRIVSLYDASLSIVHWKSVSLRRVDFIFQIYGTARLGIVNSTISP